MMPAEFVSKYSDFDKKFGQPLSDQSPHNVGMTFDRIAPTYNLINHILSFGQDFSWRKKVAEAVEQKHDLQVLDMATGTGDLLISMLRRNPNITEAIGLDISENMLALCQQRIARYKLAKNVRLVLADATTTGFANENFDIVTMGLGIRNTPDVSKTISEIYRLLKYGGMALILEFSIPTNRILRKCHLFYLRRFLPLLGRLISGDKKAYHYLSTSIENFYDMNEFCRLMRKSGFSNVSATPLTFGVACIYKGVKLNEPKM
jgi:demethylmenaquinone methyltransferase/2-methoxy-6-polyprenyl-1,4-benzoquinol methylase